MKPQLQSTHTQLENPAKPIELSLVLDRSDSMNSLAPTTVAAFNMLLEQQRKLNAAATRSPSYSSTRRANLSSTGTHW